MQTGEGKTLTAAFPAYLNNYPAARPPVEKMLVIDRLIHEFHYSFKALPDQSTRPVGVNLIKRESHVRDRVFGRAQGLDPGTPRNQGDTPIMAGVVTEISTGGLGISLSLGSGRNVPVKQTQYPNDFSLRTNVSGTCHGIRYTA